MRDDGGWSERATAGIEGGSYDLPLPAFMMIAANNGDSRLAYPAVPAGVPERGL